MLKYIILVLIGTMMASFASLFLKKASVYINTIKSFFLNVNLYLGGTLYCISALCSIIAMKYLDYSLVVPLGAFTYVWTIFISRVFLKEKINKTSIAGVVMIVIGATIFAL